MSDPGKTVRRFIAAIEAKDIDLAMTMVTEDVSYENMPIAPIVGKTAMRATLNGFLAQAKTVDWKIIRQVVVGNLVINERLDRFAIGDGWLDLPIAGFFEVNDSDLISVWRDYFDMATYGKQFASLSKAKG